MQTYSCTQSCHEIVRSTLSLAGTCSSLLGRHRRGLLPALHGLLQLAQLPLSLVQHSLTQLYEILPVYHLYIWVLACLVFIFTQRLSCSCRFPSRDDTSQAAVVTEKAVHAYQPRKSMAPCDRTAAALKMSEDPGASPGTVAAPSALSNL